MTTWYMWAVNDNPATSQYLAQIVGAESEFDTANMKGDAPCADGMKRNLYVCPNGYADVLRAVSTIEKFGLKFEVFRTNGEERPVRFDLWKRLVRKKAKHQRSALMPRLHRADKALA